MPTSTALLLVALFVETDQQTPYHQKWSPEHLVNGYIDFPEENMLLQHALFLLARILFSLDAMTSVLLPFCFRYFLFLDFPRRVFLLAYLMSFLSSSPPSNSPTVSTLGMVSEITPTAATQEMTPGRAVGFMLRRSADLTPEEKMTLTQMCQVHPHVEYLNTSLQHFLSMVRHLRGDELEQWIQNALQSTIPEMIAFAKKLRQDQTAVQVG